MRHNLPLLVFVAWRIHEGCASTKRSSTNSAKAPPWQQDQSSSSSANSRGYDDHDYADLPPTVFSPSGRLPSLERAVQRLNDPSDPSSSLVVAIHCRRGVAIVASLPQSPYLYDPPQTAEVDSSKNLTTTTDLLNDTNVTATHRSENGTANVTSATSSTSQDAEDSDRGARAHRNPLVVTFRQTSASESSARRTLLNRRPPPLPFCILGSNVVAAVSGMAPDGHVLRNRLHRMARELREGLGDIAAASTSTNGARTVARRLADAFHLRTLREANNGDDQDDNNGNSYRILASGAILCDRRELWRVDPSGQFYRCRAAVSGRASAKAEAVLVEVLLARSKRNRMEGASEESKGESSAGYDGRQVRHDLYELTLDEALAIATETIRTTLQSSAPVLSRAALGGAGSADRDGTAVRVLGLTLPCDASGIATTNIPAEWHDEGRLADIARQMRQLES